MSSTRQLGTVAGGRPRNSCAETNVSTSKPSWRSNSSSDSRTEMSSSTTRTIDELSGIGKASPQTQVLLHEQFYICDIIPQQKQSFDLKRGIQRLKHSSITERLDQICGRTLRDKPRP